jgi:hypothetical protein
MRSFVSSRTERPPDLSSDRPQVDVIEFVTVPDSGGRGVGERRDVIPASLVRALLAVALVAALVAVAVLETAGASGRRAVQVTPLAHARGAVGVAAAYGYPRRCLTVTIPARDRDYARADFSASACGRYTWAPTAIFHRVDGAWYRVLDADQYRCPVDSLPAAVQVELGVCPSRPGLAGIH